MRGPVLAWGDWPTNAHLIADCVKLGYLRDTDTVLDPTYGKGTFWKVWRPTAATLFGTDGVAEKSPSGMAVDVRHLPWDDRYFDATVFDPPYKLNGTSRPEDVFVDERYGVHEKATWQDRMALIVDGTLECARVTRRHLLVKCQDQVVSGKKRWQTLLVNEAAEKAGFGLVDRFDFHSYRPQPMEGRTQRTAHVCSSQLLVFARDHRWRP